MYKLFFNKFQVRDTLIAMPKCIFNYVPTFIGANKFPWKLHSRQNPYNTWLKNCCVLPATGPLFVQFIKFPRFNNNVPLCVSSQRCEICPRCQMHSIYRPPRSTDQRPFERFTAFSFPLYFYLARPTQKRYTTAVNRMWHIRYRKVPERHPELSNKSQSQCVEGNVWKFAHDFSTRLRKMLALLRFSVFFCNLRSLDKETITYNKSANGAKAYKCLMLSRNLAGSTRKQINYVWILRI